MTVAPTKRQSRTPPPSPLTQARPIEAPRTIVAVGIFAVALIIAPAADALASTPHDASAQPLPRGWSRTFRASSAENFVSSGDVENPAASPPRVQLPAAVDDMQTAAEQLAAVGTLPAAGESQLAALEKLDAALAELQRQCQQCMGGKSSKSTEQASEKPSSNKPGSKRGGAQPAGSAVASGQGEAGAAASAVAEKLARDLWGELPERQRDEMLQPLREEFLPQYAEDIEAYFRGLAEPANDADGRP